MALPVIGTVTNATTPSAAPSTVIASHVLDAGSDTGLLVFVAASNQTITSVTWDSGGAAEQALVEINTGTRFNSRLSMFGFKGLTPATKDITIVHTSTKVVSTAISLTGVDQTAQWIASDTDSQAGGADVAAVSVAGFTASANGLLIGGVGMGYVAGTVTEGTGFTEHSDNNTTGPTVTLETESKSNVDTLTATCSATTSWRAAGITVYGASAQVITSINGGSAVTDGQASVAVVASGFTALPTAGVYDDDATGTFDTTVTSSLAGTATNFTFDTPSVKDYTVATAGSPFTTASHTLSATFTYSAETADGAFTLNPATNWNIRELSSPLTTEGYLFYTGGSDGWDLAAPANADQIYFYSTETVDTGAADYFDISAAGLINTNISTGSVAGQFFDQTTGMWYPFTVLLGSGSGGRNRFLLGVG